ncbi:MAG: gliding motility-associated C-terminal domain-containing protein, partial [Saprospiraceae bacterium]|nr:gliding motility-associated C-terminal domain-containing protein [Saprospiraceae bacterium]
GVFTDVFTNQNGCDSVVVTTVSLLPPGECSISFQLAAAVIPCGSNESSITIEVEQGQLPLAYSYSGAGGISGSGEVTTSPFSLPPLPAGQYSVTLSAANGLSATESVEIVQATPPTVAIDLLSGIPCSGEPLAALSANVLGPFPPYSLEWSNGATTPTITGLGAGSYEVSVTGDFGCAATAAMTVTELPSFEIGFTVSNPDCFENSNGSVTVSVVGGQQPYQFSLNNGVFQADNSFDDLTDGAYQIAVEDGNGCKQTAAFAINAPLTPSVSLGDDMTIEAGDGVNLQAIVNLPDSLISSILWTGLEPNPECPSCLDQPTVPLVTSTYSIVVESVDGCTDSDDITIVVNKDRPVYVPNAFSPNGDGINEAFYPFAKDGTVANVNNFLIFNRWGDLVFEAYGFQPNLPEFGWDGSYRGALMDADVFTWYTEIKFKDGQVQLLKGDVTLVR